MLLNRVAARFDVFKKVVSREFTCNIILDYESDNCTVLIVTAFQNNIEIFSSN